jgi:O-antigen/teichoic acid export membrane protein
MLVVLGINVVGNLVAIPLDGITGAALVMIASEAASWCLGALYFHKEAGYRLSYCSGVIACIAAGTTAGLYALCDEVAGVRVGHGLALVPEGALVLTCYALLLAGGFAAKRQLLFRVRIDL